MDQMGQWVPLIQDFGFPVVVTLYLLHRIEGKLDKLNDSIVKLPERMNEPTYPRKKETV